MNPFLLTLQLLLLPAGQEDGASNTWARPVNLPRLEQPTLVAVELDQHAFRFGRADQSDIRVKTATGEPESLLVRRPTQNRPRLVPVEFQGDTVSAGPGPGGSFSLVVRLRPDQPKPESLRVLTPLRDFEKRVLVEGLDQNGKATTLAEALIADYSSIADFRLDSVALDPGQHRQFRVTIDSPTVRQESALRELVRKAGKPELERLQVTTRTFRVDRIEFSGTAEARDGEQTTWDMAHPRELTIARDNATRETIYRFEADQRPLVGLELTGTDGNYRRSVRLEYLEKYRSNPVWKPVATGVVSRFSFQGNIQESSRITFPEARHGTMRLVVSNLDSPPIQATGLRLLVARVEVLFMANPGQAYHLEYGDPKARGPAFDTSGIDAALALGVTPVPVTLRQPSLLQPAASPGAPGETPSQFIPEPEKVPEGEGAPFFRPWVFGLILLVLGAVLTVSLVQAAAKMDGPRGDNKIEGAGGQPADPDTRGEI